MKTETLMGLQSRIYNQNKELGWHDEPRSYNTFACLFHSELSEAMEGLRKGLKDDKLKHYPMFQVELADFVIRCFDYLGSVFNDDYDTFEFVVNDTMTEIDMLAWLHHSVSMSMDVTYEQQSSCNRYLSSAIRGCFTFAEQEGFNLLQIINEKIEYNKHRADHKRENRAKDGGKKF